MRDNAEPASPQLVKPFTIELPELTTMKSASPVDRIAEEIDSFMEVSRLPPSAIMPMFKPR